ncbi:hypothetical protein K461DRAFT_283810 [Myriangium duriaei CBS 260.36]|uniref:2-haloalkanoic acid dehalogenase n=1 Tax=Myriangium duriaei CBS 260.36 TaxID=1168546 RepID=A0A9P4JDJ5_9PEZI|nr:hypothetical protein K461DRAFT_283810 [Myriangium duriaei CBS 260.36]
MEPRKRHVVFDVVGTCVSYEAIYDRIHSVLGSRLLEHNITAAHFGYAWETAAELKILWMAGIQNPREIASDDERYAFMDRYAQLKIRDECQECFECLRHHDYLVWCFTSGDVARVRGYFEKAGVDVPWRIFRHLAAHDGAYCTIYEKESCEELFKIKMADQLSARNRLEDCGL